MARRKSRYLRPPGLVVFLVFVALLCGVWWLLADRLVQRSVESTGEMLIGARVDLESADVRPSEGVVSLRGLTVANPDQPMKNLFEAEEISGDLMIAPLLEKKVVVQRLVVSGVKFGTDRETSGALENPDPEAGALWREVDAWASAIDIPELSLDGLLQTVRTEAISPDSLATVQFARTLATRADSLRTHWEATLISLDPRPRVDTLASVVQRLEGFRLTPLSAVQVPGLIRDGRAALASASELQQQIGALDDTVVAGLANLAVDRATISELRAQDLTYARGLLNVPSFDAPTVSPALFGESAVAWLRPVLFWANTAERYLPPGLDPRNRPGPDRARAAGTTFDFRRGAEYPAFLLQEGDIGLELTGAAAGLYSAKLRGLTTTPALIGEPMEITLGRTAGGNGSNDLALAVVLDHTGPTIRDSLSFAMTGLALPTVDLGSIGGSLDLGRGLGEMSLARTGDQIAGRVRWSSESLTWNRAPGVGGADPGTPVDAPALGSRRWAEDLLWRTLTGMGNVTVEIALDGQVMSPGVAISSNVGDAVATSFRREMGRELDAAEARLRSEVNALIQPAVAQADERLGLVRSQVGERVAERRAEVEALRSRLEARIAELVGQANAPR